MNFCSIIIPTLNRSEYLFIAIEGFCKQNFNKNQYEIIVIDNGSTDNTAEVVDSAIKRNPKTKIRYIYENVPGLLSGRHRGAFEAIGDILIFVDDDIEPNPMWLSAIQEAFQDQTVHLVGGKNLPKYEVPPPEWLKYFWKRRSKMSAMASLSLFDYGDKVDEIDPIFVWGLNFSIRKATFFEVGGFHPDCISKDLQRYQGDGEIGLTMKLKSKGYKALYHPGAWVYHRIPEERMTVTYFEERQYYQGVCDSFSEIRKNGGLCSIVGVTKKENFGISKNGLGNVFRPSLSFLSTITHGIVSEFKKNWYFLFKHNVYMIKRRMEKAYWDGYRFHQNEAARNPAVIDWVLKKDYLNYKLPELNP